MEVLIPAIALGGILAFGTYVGYAILQRYIELKEMIATLQTRNESLGLLNDENTVLEERLKEALEDVRFQKGRAQSAHTSKGLLLEKWTPFVNAEGVDESWKPEDWAFLGKPIDYVVFDWRKNVKENLKEGKIVFLDVKAANSGLTTKQRRIRDLVKEGQIEWREIRLN